MTWINVDNMTNSDLGNELTSSNESIGNNTGSFVSLATKTGTSTEWGDDDAFESVANNTKSLLTDAVAELKSQYPNKDINVNGIVITKVQV